MAFSTSQRDILQGLYSQYYKLGYKHYIAYLQNTSNDNPFDMVVFFIKEDVSGSADYSTYSLTIPAGSIGVYCATGNYNSMNTSNRIQWGYISSDTPATLPRYYTISSNIFIVSSMYETVEESAVQVPDLVGGVIDAQIQTGGMLFVMCVGLLVFCFFKLFRR